MEMIYLFDVDGTLTPAKNIMNPEFARVFFEWQKDKEVYIVSGGSFPRILDQLGRNITDAMHGVFSCMGNVFYKKQPSTDGYSSWSKEYENQFSVAKPKLFFSELERCVMASEYPVKVGKHYEKRPGMVNFSIVGHGATAEEREAYATYDAQTGERKKIIAKLCGKYPQLDFVIGGAVSIDIFNKGCDKSQVIERYFKKALKTKQIVFVGDRIAYPGNDYSLAELLMKHDNGLALETSGWRETAELLKGKLFASS